MSLDFKQIALAAELSWLRRQQRKAMEDATFLGWGPRGFVEFGERGDRIAVLRWELARPAGEKRTV